MAQIESVAVDLGDGLELDETGTIRKDGKVAQFEDAPVRDELPDKHPLRGTRCVKRVLSGMPDSVIEDGRLVPYKSLETEPEPIDLEPIR